MSGIRSLRQRSVFNLHLFGLVCFMSGINLGSFCPDVDLGRQRKNKIIVRYKASFSYIDCTAMVSLVIV